MGYSPTPDGFGRRGANITPGNADLPDDVSAIVLTTSGDVTILPHGNAPGTEITFQGVPSGFVPPYRVRRVTAATAGVASIIR